MTYCTSCYMSYVICFEIVMKLTLYFYVATFLCKSIPVQLQSSVLTILLFSVTTCDDNNICVMVGYVDICSHYILF